MALPCLYHQKQPRGSSFVVVWLLFCDRCFLYLPVDKHQQEGGNHQDAADQNRLLCHAADGDGADDGTNHKAQNDAVKEQASQQCLPVFGKEVVAQGLGGSAEVTNAHGSGSTAAVDFAKTLYLCTAGQRNQTVGRQITGLRQKAHSQENQCLKKHCDLAPVKERTLLQKMPVDIRAGNAYAKRENGEEILQCFGKVSLREIDPQQKNIAGLGIGKDMSST